MPGLWAAASAITTSIGWASIDTLSSSPVPSVLFSENIAQIISQLEDTISSNLSFLSHGWHYIQPMSSWAITVHPKEIVWTTGVFRRGVKGEGHTDYSCQLSPPHRHLPVTNLLRSQCLKQAANWPRGPIREDNEDEWVRPGSLPTPS